MTKSELLPGDYDVYYQTYIDTLGDVDLLEQLEKQLLNFPEFIASIPADKLHYAYAESKWTIAEVLLHLLDTERVFQYRALRFGRGDKTPVPGFDQDIYVPNCNASSRSIADIIEEYCAIRNTTLFLFRNFKPADLQQNGISSDANITVAAIGFIIAGHQKHHRNIIRERYL